MNRRFRKRLAAPLIHAAALAIAAAALTSVLQVRGQFLGWFALALWLAGESALLVPWIAGSPSMKDATPQSSNHGATSRLARNHAARGLIELGLLGALAIGLAARGPSVTTLQLDSETRKALLALLNSKAGPGPDVGGAPPALPGEITLKLDSEFRQAIVDALQKSAAPGVGRGWAILIVILIAAATGLLLYKLGAMDRESVTPLATASGIALAMIYEAPVLPKPGGGVYWAAVFGLGIAGGWALCWGWKQVAAPAPANGEASPPPANAETSPPGGTTTSPTSVPPRKTGGEKEQSLIVVGFSLLLIAATLAYVASRPNARKSSEPTGKSGESGSATPEGSVPSFDVEQLNDVTGFSRGSWMGGQIGNLKGDLDTKTRKGDILFLVGSTDCTRMSTGNQALADRRATWTSGQLAGYKTTLKIETAQGLPQQAACKDTADVRVVHAFLFHDKSKDK